MVYGLLVIGYWLLVIEWVMVGFEAVFGLWFIGYWLLVMVYWLLVIGYGLSNGLWSVLRLYSGYSSHPRLSSQEL